MLQPSQPLFLKHLILPIQSANKHMKKMKIPHCLLLEKCKSRLQWDIPHTSQNGHQQKNLQTVNAGEGVEKRECSCTAGGDVNWCSHYGRQYGKFLKNLGIKPPYDPAIPLLGIYPEETKTENKNDTCTPVFLTALFTTVRTWKNLDVHQQMNG